MWIYVIKSHNIVEKNHKTVNFCDKKSQLSDKKSKNYIFMW